MWIGKGDNFENAPGYSKDKKKIEQENEKATQENAKEQLVKLGAKENLAKIEERRVKEKTDKFNNQRNSVLNTDPRKMDPDDRVFFDEKGNTITAAEFAAL